jgi:hypothetical protein
MRERQETPAAEIPVNRRAYRAREIGDGVVQSITGSVYAQRGNGTRHKLRRPGEPVTKAIRRRPGLTHLTNKEAQQVLDETYARLAKEKAA